MAFESQRRFRACIFDLDGTLLYTLPTIHHYCNASLSHFHLHSITITECQELCRLSISHFYQRLLLLGGCPPDKVHELQPQIRDYDCAAYLKDFTYLTEPYPGMTETLQALRRQGMLAGVLTNKPHAIANSLVRHFFGDLVSVCIGQTPNTISKPDPRCMDEILIRLSCEKDDLVYIGDTDVDMETAQNTGVTAIAAAWGYQPLTSLLPYHPAFIAQQPTDILQFLNQSEL